MFKNIKPSFLYISKSALCALAICIMLFGLLLTDSQAAPGIVNGSVVNVRSAPSSSGEIIGTLLKDTQVEILGISGDWYQIKFAKLQGYVARELITSATTAAATTIPKTTTKAATSAVKTAISIPVPSVILNHSPMQFEVSPRIENGRTLVPLRAIFEAMGANVEWDATTRTVTARNSITTVVLPLDSTSPTVNGQIYKLEVPAKIVNDRTLAPLRFVGEAFGGKVDWNAQTTTITITYAAPPAPAAVTVTGGAVNLREAPLVTAVLVGTAVNGETMTVLNEQDGWYQVKHGSITAWVASWVVETASVEAQEPASAEPAAPVVVEPIPPAVISPEPTVPEAPDNALYLARTKNASGITVTISSKIKMEPTIEESSGSIQYTFTNRSLSGLNYFEEAMGVNKLKVKASSQDDNTLIAVTLPGNVEYKKTAAADGKQLIIFIPNYIINIEKTSFGSVGDRYIISTLCPTTGTGNLSGDKLNVIIPQMRLPEGSSYNFSSDLVKDMKVESDPDNVLITFNTTDLNQYSFAASGSNNDLNIILMKKMDIKPREKIVVLDAGHGGRDTGARGSQIDEKVVNLAVTLKAGELLKAKGIRVEYTRIDDSYIGLLDRSYIANNLNATAFVSIHSNSNTSSTPGGTETYFYAPLSTPELYVQRTERSRLAALLQTALANNLQRNNRGVKESNFSVLRESLMPAALIEMAFLSNPDEQALLMSEDFQNRAASAVADAVEQYMSGSSN